MSIKKIIASLILLPIFLFCFVSPTVSANTEYSEQQRLELLKQLQNLLSQLLVLQKQLESGDDYALSSKSIIQTKTPYESKFYNFPHESIYFVVDGYLINSEKSEGISNVDQQLFSLFTKVVGREALDKWVVEWRIFNREADLGAYVELQSTTQTGPRNWIVGVNREGFGAESSRSFASLFIHEYAHIILYDYEEFKTDFRNDFWTAQDILNEKKVEQFKDEKRFKLTSDYFEKNQQRFVSDYATISSDEDMAETFTYFVLEDKPLADSVRNQKILTFYNEADLVKIREQIRNNLKKLGIL